MEFRTINRLVAISLVASFFVLSASCKREEPPKGVVITLDSLDKPVSGVTVKLYSTGSKGPGTVKGQGTTDSEGKAYFNEFTLPAILNVYCTKVKASGDTLKGTGILRLEIDKENESKITMR